MKIRLALQTVNLLDLNQKLKLIEGALNHAVHVCTSVAVAPASGANVAFTVPHTLGVRPDSFSAFAWTGTGVAGASEAEQNTWNETFITVHSSVASAKFTFTIVSLG